MMESKRTSNEQHFRLLLKSLDTELASFAACIRFTNLHRLVLIIIVFNYVNGLLNIAEHKIAMAIVRL